jgi:GxxExxY protein
MGTNMNHEDAKRRSFQKQDFLPSSLAGEHLAVETERLAKIAVNCAFRVHKNLGPGLLESVYEVCLAHELKNQSVSFDRQPNLPILYEGISLDAGLRLDFVIGNSLIVELKAVESLLPIHTAQILTYLKLTGIRLGLLINFNVALIKDGIHRIIR